jgi:DNA-binding protein H-NS
MEGLGSALVGLFGIAAVAAVYKTFQEGGKATKYELHETFKTKAEASKEAARMRAKGIKARFTKSGNEFNVWITQKTSNFMTWPYN